MIYASNNAAGAPQPGIHSIENPALEQQHPAELHQPEIDTEFAQITSQFEPVAAPERLGNLVDDTVYAVGYEAVGHTIDQDGVNKVTAAVGAARLPERFYVSGRAPEKSLKEVAQSYIEQVHPAVEWQQMQEQQSRAFNAGLGESRADEDGKPSKKKKARKEQRSDFSLAA